MDVIIILVIVLISLVVLAIINRFRNKAKVIEKLKSSYGFFSTKEYSAKQYRADEAYFKSQDNTRFTIDDTTFNDLDMKLFYEAFNSSITSVGSEFTYSAIRKPIFDSALLERRDKLAIHFAQNDKARLDTQYTLSKVGRLKEISMSECIKSIVLHKKTSNIIEVGILLAIIGLVVASIIKVALTPFLLVGMFISVLLYFKKRSGIKLYFVVFKYAISLLNQMNRIYKINKEALDYYDEDIKRINEKLGLIKRASYLLNENNGDLLSLVLEYIYMITHIDLISFNIMTKTLQKNIDVAMEMFEIVGEIELAINIASFREALAINSTPIFDKKAAKFLKATSLVHPLLLEPVANDFSTEESVLITGSNASGKSTFLKAVALNSIMAQTIYTVSASRFESSYFKVVSSMALRDNLMANESYYIVEIKSLRRIVSMSDEVPVLCFVDEILRGTNTIERISASSVILEELSKKNCICLAATHDIELTKLLKDVYTNYHFTESVEDGKVKFDYLLRIGPTTTRNAILLLEVIGFPKDITTKANERVKMVEDLSLDKSMVGEKFESI